MTDKELLELAAKAAGIDLGQCACGGTACSGVWNKASCMEWSPLTDDGDALKLAVKLEFSMDLFDDVILVGYSLGKGTDQVQEDIGTDPYAATRRAIVRAAAEIGAAK